MRNTDFLLVETQICFAECFSKREKGNCDNFLLPREVHIWFLQRHNFSYIRSILENGKNCDLFFYAIFFPGGTYLLLWEAQRKEKTRIFALLFFCIHEKHRFASRGGTYLLLVEKHIWFCEKLLLVFLFVLSREAKICISLWQRPVLLEKRNNEKYCAFRFGFLSLSKPVNVWSCFKDLDARNPMGKTFRALNTWFKW